MTLNAIAFVCLIQLSIFPIAFPLCAPPPGFAQNVYSHLWAFPRGYLLYLCTVVCAWRVKFKSKNMDSLKILHPKYWDLGYFLLPWIRVAVEKPMAGPGGAKEVGKRGRLWSPWTSLSGTAPIRINIQNLDVGFHWFISDRSREITHSLLCNLLSGRSPTNHSTQV